MCQNFSDGIFQVKGIYIFDHVAQVGSDLCLMYKKFLMMVTCHNQVIVITKVFWLSLDIWYFIISLI
jgi:hypothetical protein